jgi:putative ubiquitin-RnfH superfamily antitoxin RatB of RatAB toxin-antitoxin module
MYTIEVVYALLKKQISKKVKIKENSTINDCICLSMILLDYPEIDLTINKVGIYNQVKKLDEIVKDGDRVEIYRPLIANPKEVRRKRAQKQKEQGIIK